MGKTLVLRHPIITVFNRCRRFVLLLTEHNAIPYNTGYSLIIPVSIIYYTHQHKIIPKGLPMLTLLHECAFGFSLATIVSTTSLTVGRIWYVEILWDASCPFERECLGTWHASVSMDSSSSHLAIAWSFCS